MPDDFVAVNTSDRAYAQNDLEARDLVFERIKDDIVFCKGVLYYRENHIWIDCGDSIFDMLIELVMSMKIYKRTEKDDVEYSHIYSCAKNITLSVICLVKSKSNNNWLKIGQYSSLGKILFENGYYDFKKKEFYKFDDVEFDKSIVFTGKIHHSFEPFTGDEIDYMDSIQERLFYNTLGEAVGDYLILNIARGLAGDMMKRIMFGLGGTNTGKSVLTSAVMWRLFRVIQC
jgi:hypothetical protein